MKRWWTSLAIRKRQIQSTMRPFFTYQNSKNFKTDNIQAGKANGQKKKPSYTVLINRSGKNNSAESITITSLWLFGSLGMLAQMQNVRRNIGCINKADVFSRLINRNMLNTMEYFHSGWKERIDIYGLTLKRGAYLMLLAKKEKKKQNERKLQNKMTHTVLTVL